MTRLFFNTTFFLIGVYFALVAVSAHAQVSPVIPCPSNLPITCANGGPAGPYYCAASVGANIEGSLRSTGPVSGWFFAESCPDGRNSYTRTIVGCASGQVVEATGECYVAGPTCPSAGSTAFGLPLQVSGTGSIPNDFCWDGCKVKSVGFAMSGSFGGVGSWGLFAPFQHLGTTCATSNPTATGSQSDPAPPPKPCGVGTCYGTVNGVSVCLPCSDSKQITNSKDSTKDPAGAVTTNSTTTTTTVNNDGTVTISSKTTTTVQPAGGGSPTVTTDEKDRTIPKETFCAENPELSICKDSVFGGTCAGFTCSGDAIQCAIAKEQHVRNCRVFDEVTASSTLGDAMMANADPMKTSFPTDPSQKTVTSMSGMIDQSRLLSVSCPADFTFSISGHAVSIPFSSLCTPMTWLGYLFVAVTLLAATRMVFDGT